MIPYGKQTIDSNDKKAVMDVLEENTYLTTGPLVPEFEKRVCEYIGCSYGVAVNSGTAALHCATFAAGIGKGDEVIVSAISFVASANCILYQGGTPVFCDVEHDTMNIDVSKIENLITKNTKALIMVDMCGQPCDFDKIRTLCNKHKLILIQDAAHSLGGKYKNQKVGSYADITCLSFHPVKNITTCEGGMMVTNNNSFFKRGQACRSHGITKTFIEREKNNSYFYDMVDLGFNYRIPDVLCALGISQLEKIDNFIEKRNRIAKKYNDFFEEHKHFVEPLKCYYDSAYHIYVIKLNLKNLNLTRDEIFKKLKESGIGVNVHYRPIYLHSYYQNLNYKKGLCPNAEEIYNQIITLPIFPLLKDEEVDYICQQVLLVCKMKNESH